MFNRNSSVETSLDIDGDNRKAKLRVRAQDWQAFANALDYPDAETMTRELTDSGRLAIESGGLYIGQNDGQVMIIDVTSMFWPEG